MARRPYFSGNYGSALGSTANAANLIARAGEVQGNMYANMGQQIGGMIKQYGLNKEKRNKLQSTLEGQLSADPSIVQQLTMTGDEQYDKKNMKLFDKVQSGDASIADLERANGLLSGKTTQENAMLKKQNAETQQRMNELNLEVTEMLKDPMVSDAIGRYELNKVNRASQKKTIPSDTEVRLKTNESKLKTLPSQTDATRSANTASSLQNDTKSADILLQGGPGGMAQQLQEDRDLARQDKQSQIDYRNNAGLAQLYKSLAQKNPTFAEQFTPLAALQDKLRGLTVKTPKGESVSYAEYEKLHNDDPDLYPMNNEPGAIKGQIESVNSQIYNLSRDQPAQVNVPDNLPQDGMDKPTEKRLPQFIQDHSWLPGKRVNLEQKQLLDNIDSQTAQLMAGPGALKQAQKTITDPATIAVLKRGGTLSGKTLQQLINEGVIIQGL